MMTITNLIEIIFPNTQEETYNWWKVKGTFLKTEELIHMVGWLNFFTTGYETLSKLSSQA